MMSRKSDEDADHPVNRMLSTLSTRHERLTCPTRFRRPAYDRPTEPALQLRVIEYRGYIALL